MAVEDELQEAPGEAKPVRRRRGRGARERILEAATSLFYRQGINATGMEQLAVVADVSKRTLYLHFQSKEALVEAYLDQLDDQGWRSPESALDRLELPPRERLLGVFATAPGSEQASEGPTRGCAFLNAAVEVPDPVHPVHERAARHKVRFAERLAATAREAGAADPDFLGRQLALLYDGAASRSVVLNSAEPGLIARGIAEGLIDAAIRANAHEAGGTPVRADQ